jgi:regulator of protease activity HflC (stomatin/prohibitin superfamily)
LPLIIGVLLLFLVAGLRLLEEHTRGVILRLGKLQGVKLPGVRWIIPMVDRMIRVRVQNTVEVSREVVFTQDEREVWVNATIRYHVTNAALAVVEVYDHVFGTRQIARICIRDAFRSETSRGLRRRLARLQSVVQRTLDSNISVWGLKVDSVDLSLADGG